MYLVYVQLECWGVCDVIVLYCRSYLLHCGVMFQMCSVEYVMTC